MEFKLISSLQMLKITFQQLLFLVFEYLTFLCAFNPVLHKFQLFRNLKHLNIMKNITCYRDFCSTEISTYFFLIGFSIAVRNKRENFQLTSLDCKQEIDNDLTLREILLKCAVFSPFPIRKNTQTQEIK